MTSTLQPRDRTERALIAIAAACLALAIPLIANALRASSNVESYRHDPLPYACESDLATNPPTSVSEALTLAGTSADCLDALDQHAQTIRNAEHSATTMQVASGAALAGFAVGLGLLLRHRRPHYRHGSRPPHTP